MMTRNIPSPISAHARPLTTLDNAGMSSKAFSTEAIKSAPTTTRDPAAISANPMSWNRVEMFVDSEKNSQSSKEFLFVCFDDKIISFSYDKTKYIYKICTGCKYIKKRCSIWWFMKISIAMIATFNPPINQQRRRFLFILINYVMWLKVGNNPHTTPFIWIVFMTNL